LGIIWLIEDALHISGMAERRNFTLCTHIVQHNDFATDGRRNPGANSLSIMLSAAVSLCTWFLLYTVVCVGETRARVPRYSVGGDSLVKEQSPAMWPTTWLYRSMQVYTMGQKRTVLELCNFLLLTTQKNVGRDRSVRLVFSALPNLNIHTQF